MEKTQTDARLDDLSEKVDRGFEKLDRRLEKMEQRIGMMDQRIERLEGRFDAFQHALLQGLVAIVVALTGGFATILAAVIWAS